MSIHRFISFNIRLIPAMSWGFFFASIDLKLERGLSGSYSESWQSIICWISRFFGVPVELSLIVMLVSLLSAWRVFIFLILYR